MPSLISFLIKKCWGVGGGGVLIPTSPPLEPLLWSCFYKSITTLVFWFYQRWSNFRDRSCFKIKIYYHVVEFTTNFCEILMIFVNKSKKFVISSFSGKWSCVNVCSIFIFFPPQTYMAWREYGFLDKGIRKERANTMSIRNRCYLLYAEKLIQP